MLDGNPNAMEFCTLAQLDGRSFDAVVVCDLTAEAFSVADRSDSQAAFLEALGCSPATPTLQSLRRQMRAALESARSRVVFERCLQDPEAKALRPSALFEEIVDCYRPDPTAIDDLDRTTGLPKDGQLSYASMGEERFSLLASPVTWTPATFSTPAPAVVPTSDEALARMASPERLRSPGRARDLPELSPALVLRAPGALRHARRHLWPPRGGLLLAPGAHRVPRGPGRHGRPARRRQGRPGALGTGARRVLRQGPRVPRGLRPSPRSHHEPRVETPRRPAPQPAKLRGARRAAAERLRAEAPASGRSASPTPSPTAA